MIDSWNFSAKTNPRYIGLVRGKKERREKRAGCGRSRGTGLKMAYIIRPYRWEKETGRRRGHHVAGETVEIIAGRKEKWDKLGARRRPRRHRTPSHLWIESSYVARIGYVDKYSILKISILLAMFIYTDQISNRKYRIRKKKKKQKDRISVSMGRMYGTASLTCVTYFTCIENERET